MFAVIVNTIAIIIGTCVGLLVKKGIPKEISSNILKALGVCTVIIGIQGAIQTSNILILILSIALGVFVGEFFNFEGKVNRFFQNLLGKIAKGENSVSKITEAFITSCLIMNVGAMVIVGSLDAGLRENYSMLYTKSLLDLISGIMLAATMGAGVFGSAAFTLIFQGTIVLLSKYISPYMSEFLIGEISATGCAIILALGFNMIGITQFKVINYIPALLMVPLSIFIIALLPL
ncbi:DUF554 domain-containing protein [Succinivibrio dextrinosolvens]|uniref:DUF554 domain-containing protein n=1 Tax=Succinivibrio dextrinosolvens TaxID=83771 RepID=A0A662ZAI3_9GAMM|nr:DUF554 domain-containing protein [Succinivibrio dextrinosolvens]SFK22299.1 hypothetical protein SAMN04487865_10402 [Succinivibrio dextrinosolvens]